jgi:hypothetical protein
MSSITIRNLDPAVKERLRVRAAEHGTPWKPKYGAFFRPPSRSRNGRRGVISTNESALALSFSAALMIWSCRHA